MGVRARRATPEARESPRRPRHHGLAGPLIGLLVAAAMPARSATITCPPMLLETPVVNSMLAGWDVDIHAGRRTLAGAAIHVSRGSERNGVAPDATHVSGHDEMASWTLSPGDGEVYWVACSYGNTSALLLQRVPDKARRCVARAELLQSGRHLNVQPVECN